VPVHPIAAPRIRALIAAARPGQTVLLVDEASGQPYSEGLFQDRWAAVRARAAKTHPSVASLQFRDLRRSFGVWARAGGAGRDDVGNVLGNSASVDPRLNETYMPPSFDTASRAVAAVRRPDDKERKAG
jgi:integrase